MKIKHYKRMIFSKGEYIGIHKNICSCSHRTCGKDERTTGWVLIFFGHIFCLELNKPEKCDAPF